MTFHLRIETDGAAFGEDDGDCEVELAALLRRVADKLLEGKHEDTIRDTNGNTCGSYHL